MSAENPLEAMRRLTDPLARTAFRGAYALARAYWLVLRPETQGACVGVWHGGEVLLIQNSYKPGFTLPGGHRRRAEPWAEAGARELLEEVGVRVEARALREVFETTSTVEHKRDHVRFFEVDVEAPPPVTIDRREVVWGAFLDVGAALRLPLAPVARAYLEDAARRRGHR